MADYTPTSEETDKEKNSIIKDVKPELKEHGLVDLTDFINKRNKEGFINNHGFVRSVAYKLEEMGEAEVIVRKEWTEFYVKRNIYSKRNPKKFAAILLAIGVFFSVIAGTINAIVSECLRSKKPEKELQELKQKQQGLSGDVANLRLGLKNVQDSLAKYKR